MAQIDTNVHRAAAELMRSSGAASDEQRKGWLQSLEAVGWKIILDTMHNLPGASAVDTAASNTREADAVTVMPETSPIEVTGYLPQVEPGAAQGMDDPSQQTSAEYHSSAATQDRSTYAASGVHVVVDGSPEEEGGPRFARRTPNATENAPIPIRKVMVLPGSEHGVEVWVRDASITGAQMQMLLADIRRNAQEQGCEIVKVSVNGHPVDASRPDRLESTQAKGD